MPHTSIRLAASVGVLLLGAAVSSRADIFVNGTFAGTFYTGTDNSGATVSPTDTLGIFGAPGADLTGKTITGSFFYDASTLPLIAASPGYTDYQAANNGSVTQTVNGVTVNLGTSVYMSLVLEAPPAVTAANVFDLEVANEVPANAVAGDNFVYQYARIEFGSTPFLNGLGNVQQFSAPAGTAGGVDIFEGWTYNSGTGTYSVVTEELPFVSNLNVTATPEPALFPALFACFAVVGILVVRHRKRRSA